MKKIFLFALLGLITYNVTAQEVVIIPNSDDSRAITTGVPFVLIAADARSAGLADIGVTTSADAFSQFERGCSLRWPRH